MTKDKSSPPILTIIGRSKSGKTTLLEKLIPVFKQQGYRIGTVKHHSHAGFDIDVPGKDSWRHAQAGSEHVVIAAPDKIASIRRLKRELYLDEIVQGMQDVDLVLVEGYRRAGKPSIEIVRKERGREPIAPPEQLVAIVSDLKLEIAVPLFELEDIKGLVDFIEGIYL